jgi:hypothetical protein
MAFTNIYDDTFPADTELANLIGQNLRQVRLDVQQRMAAISGLDAAKPAFASDAQPNNWNGVLFFATDSLKVYQFNNPAWTQVFSFSSPNTNVNNQTASYIAALSDANNIVTMNVATANTFTIPANATVNFPVGTAIVVIQLGVGQVTLTAAVGVTFDTSSSTTTRAQYSVTTLIQIATNIWVLAGDLT